MNTIFITGATGFIGCRLAEVACARRISVIGLVRMWPHAVRLARLPVRMVLGDVLDVDVLRASMQGSDVVFHCAVDNGVGGDAHQRVTVEGAANVMQAARETGVKRVVHLSSVGVYSYCPKPDAATEAGSYQYSGDVYCDSKIDAEKVVLSTHQEHGLPIVVLRPTNVYGPFGYYTTHTAALIRQRRMVLVNEGTGVCNSLYVDNLVEAMLLAAERTNAVGEIFHISDDQPVSWKAFAEMHAQALGENFLPLPEMTLQEISAARVRSQRRPSSVQQTLRLLRDPRVRETLSSIPAVNRSLRIGKCFARAILPTSIRRMLRQELLQPKQLNGANSYTQSDYLPSQGELDIYTTKVVFSIDKARRVLGYTPRINFSEGMERTAAWLQWARL